MTQIRTYRLPYAITIILCLVISLVAVGYLYRRVVHKERMVNMLHRDVENLSNRVATFHLVEKMRTTVQVTAYAPSQRSTFANGVPVAAAISPVLEQSGYRMGRLLFLRDKRDGKIIPVRIVDRTSQEETRPVVDLLFTNKEEAVRWGRKPLELIDLKEAH